VARGTVCAKHRDRGEAPQFGALLYRRHAAESALLTTMPHGVEVALAFPPPRLLAVDNERHSTLYPNIWEPDVGAAPKDSRRQHLRLSSKTGKPYRVYWSER
jgi:hypothetical protein